MTNGDRALAALAIATNRLTERKASDIARRSGLSEHRILDTISELLRAGLVVNEGKESDGFSVYALTSKGWDAVGQRPPVWLEVAA